MPVMDCIKDGKRGYKWGKEGVCYTGPDAYERAQAQGRAIKARQDRESESFAEYLNRIRKSFKDLSDL